MRTEKHAFPDPTAELRTWLESVLAGKLRDLLSHMDNAQGLEKREALHKLRLAARRLETVLRVFRKWFPRKRWDAHRRMLRKLIRALGKVRERDVFLSMMESRNAPVPEAGGVVLLTLLARKTTEREHAAENLQRVLKEFDRERIRKSFTALITNSRRRLVAR